MAGVAGSPGADGSPGVAEFGTNRMPGVTGSSGANGSPGAAGNPGPVGIPAHGNWIVVGNSSVPNTGGSAYLGSAPASPANVPAPPTDPAP